MVPPLCAWLVTLAWIIPMLDFVFVVLGAALFLGALFYVRACANV